MDLVDRCGPVGVVDGENNEEKITMGAYHSHCAHCGQPFPPRTRNMFCPDKPECQAALRKRQLAQMSAAQRRRCAERRSVKMAYQYSKDAPVPAREKRVCKGWRKYKACLHWIDNGNLIWCSRCHHVISQRVGDESDLAMIPRGLGGAKWASA